MENSTADFPDPTTLVDMTTTGEITSLNPARWAPDPRVRGQLRYWDGRQWTPHTVDAISASRPELPSWFRSATIWLYAACGLASATCLALATLGLATSTDSEIWSALTSMVMTGVTALVFIAGAWGYTVAGSRCVDRRALHRDPMWFLISWFIPVISVVFPHQLFGEVWASARNLRTSRDASVATTSLVSPRPRVIGAWAWTWALASGGALLLLLVGISLGTVLLTVQVATAVMAPLLAGVIRVIAKELDGPAVSPAVS